MANGFRYISQGIGASTLLEELLMEPNTQFALGDALMMVAGEATQVGQADKADHVYEVMETPKGQLRPSTPNKSTTTGGEKCLAQKCDGTNQYFETDLTGGDAPTFDGTACNQNNDLSTVIFTGAGVSGDLTGGQVYIPELDQQRLITDDTVAGGIHTLTVYPPFDGNYAPSNRNVPASPGPGEVVAHLRAVPWSKGHTGVKFSAANAPQGISTAVADKTGGNVNIEGVDLKLRKAVVSFVDVP